MTPNVCISSISFFIILLFIASCSTNPSPPGSVSESSGQALTETQSTLTEIQPTTENIGILWAVNRADTSTSYVFGTVHSEDERVTQLPEPVSQAFNNASHLALEILLNEATKKIVLKTLYFTDERRLKSLLTPDLYSRTIDAMNNRQLPPDVTNRMKPWAVFTILSMPEQKTGLFLDALLFQMANQQNKVVHGLETAQEQTAVFDEMPMSSQIALLESTLDHLPDMDRLLNEIIEVYLSRDLDQIVAISKKYEEMIDETLAADFNQRLVIDRNYRMVERMLPLLNKGNSFIAIGALHLPGEEGILTLLEQEGYHVEAKF